MPSRTESKNFESESCFWIPAGEKIRGEGSEELLVAILTLVAHVIIRARGINENLRGLGLSLLETHRNRALPSAITVDGEFNLILVLVPERLPKKGNVFALIQQEGAVFSFVLEHR